MGIWVRERYVDPKDANSIVIARKQLDGDQQKNFKMNHKERTFMMNAITFEEFDNISDKETKNILDVLFVNYERRQECQGV